MKNIIGVIIILILGTNNYNFQWVQPYLMNNLTYSWMLTNALVVKCRVKTKNGLIV